MSQTLTLSGKETELFYAALRCERRTLSKGGPLVEIARNTDTGVTTVRVHKDIGQCVVTLGPDFTRIADIAGQQARVSFGSTDGSPATVTRTTLTHGHRSAITGQVEHLSAAQIFNVSSRLCFTRQALLVLVDSAFDGKIPQAAAPSRTQAPGNRS